MAATRTLFAASVAALACLPHSASAQSTQPGWTYATRMTVDSGEGRVTVFTTRFRIAGDRVRSENTMSGALGSSVAGMYSVIDRRDSTMMTVMPKQKMATLMSLGASFPAGAPTLRMGATHVASSRTDTLGAGETINGYETRRFRVTSTGTSDFSVGSQMCSHPFELVTDIWFAPQLDMADAVSALVGGIAGAGIPTMTDGAPPAAAPRAAGAPLRTIMRSTTRDARGNTHTVTSTMEVTELNHDAIDDSTFAVPAGYRLMDMRKLMTGAGAGIARNATRDVNEGILKTLCGTP